MLLRKAGMLNAVLGIPKYIAPLLTLITPTKGTGGTFTRNSVAWYQPAGSTTWTSASANVAAFEGGGYLSEPASTNKVTAYSVIPADTLGAELASGTVTVGQKYQITAQNTVDFTTVGAANNTVGTQFVATAATITLDATNKVKRVQWGVGEKSYHNGTAFVQNITGLTLAGDVAATLSIVDDTAALTAAGLQTIAGTKVYKLDNSAGSGVTDVSIVGATGNTNAHTVAGYARAQASGDSGSVALTSQATVATISSTSYQLLSTPNITPGDNIKVVRVMVLAGKIIYFILPQLEERATVTSPMVSQGSTTTRAATVLAYPISNLPTSGPWAVKVAFTPKMAGSASTATRTLWSSYKDASNWVSLNYNGVILYAEINKAGTKEYATKALSTTAGVTYSVVLKQDGGRFYLYSQQAKSSDGLGAELITNAADREFSSDTGFWTKSTATISGGVATITGNGSIFRDSLLVPNKMYRVGFTLGGYTSGTAGISSSTTLADDRFVTANGTYVRQIISRDTSTGKLALLSTVAGATFDDVSVKEISNSTTATPFTLGTTFEVGSFNGTQQAQANFSGLTIYGNLGDAKAISLATP